MKHDIFRILDDFFPISFRIDSSMMLNDDWSMKAITDYIKVNHIVTQDKPVRFSLKTIKV